MTDVSQDHAPLFMEKVFDQGWYHPLILTHKYVVSGNLKPSRQGDLFGLLAWADFVQDGPVDVDNVRGRARGLAIILNAVGPVGMNLIGGAIVLAMMIWWYIRCLNPPARIEMITSAK